MARNNDTQTLKEAMQKLLQSYRLQQKYTETEMVNAWGRLMGKPIAKRTTQVYFHDKKLFVKLNSAPLKQELQMSKTKVLTILRQEFGADAVEDIVFQ